MLVSIVILMIVNMVSEISQYLRLNMKNKISVVVLGKNSAHDLNYLNKSLNDFDEKILIDDFSSDESEKQSKILGFKFFKRKLDLSHVRLKPISTSEVHPIVHLAAVALVSFIISFIVTRTFTYFFPNVVLVSGGLHIHHFWFGIVLLAVGGWLGINYDDKEIDIVASIFYGVGGGLIVDEVGLLLTFGDYWSGLTWTFMILLFSFIFALLLFGRYRKIILGELHDFVSSKASLYLGIFLATISIAFIAESNNLLIMGISAGLTINAVLIVLAFLIHRTRERNKKQRSHS